MTPTSRDGDVDLASNRVNQMIGSSFDYALTITSPGYDPYLLTGSYSGYTVKRPSCAEINSPGYGNETTSDSGVKVWSTKTGNTTAKAGRTLRVTRTRATGATIAYQWRVGPKVVDRDRALTVKRAYRGKKISMRVTVTKPDGTRLRKVLRYGRAR